MIDFDIPADLAALRDEIRAFVTEQIVPYESDPRLTWGVPDDGLLTLQAPKRFGGREPSHREQPAPADTKARWSRPLNNHVSEELFKVADRCVQILGGMGISDETPVGMIFSDVRAFRLDDGPTEVHKYAIARQVLR